MTLYERVLNRITSQRQRLIDGKINCIPWGLPKFEELLPGIQQGQYYLITANSKVGKTQIADFLFLYNVVKQVIDNNIQISVKIFYFSLEMSKEEKMLAAFSHILYVKEGITVAPQDLSSTKADRILSEDVLNTIAKYKKYFEKIEEIVEFIDDVRNPTGIYNMVKTYAYENGVQYKKKVEFINNKTKEVEEIKEIDDYYQPNDPEEYVFVIIDHISLISQEKEGNTLLSKHESIVKLSSNYLVKLRNKFNYIPVVIQQQAQAQESVENLKAGRLKPSLDGLGDCKLTQRDANVVLGLFDPFRHQLATYEGYNIKLFKHRIRFMEILANRNGRAAVTCPMYFDGATNFFRELPNSQTETQELYKVYKFLENLDKNGKREQI